LTSDEPSPQLGPGHARDARILFSTRIVRLFAYGSISLILGLYLSSLGFGAEQIGLLLSMTLLGDTAFSLWLTTRADAVGRRRMLAAGALLMVLGGLVFALTGNYILLVIAATIGVISPSGNEVGPFLAIEQAALAQTVTTERRTYVFAWYNLVGSLATALGALVCGWLVQSLAGQGYAGLPSYRAILFAYAGAGILLALFFGRLSPAAEVDSALRKGGIVRRWLGLHRSRGIVFKLAALFALDAFAGGLILQSILALWFQKRFDADPRTLGGIFFGANLLAGVSALAAAAIARRIGLVNTMVFTHAPSNVLLILVPFMPTLPLAVGTLLLRFAISQMDVPARQSYTAAVVHPDERSAAAGVAGVARTTGAALSPILAGVLLANKDLAWALFLISGGLKLIYDGLLYWSFRHIKMPGDRRERS
jgi:MFS family permease